MLSPIRVVLAPEAPVFSEVLFTTDPNPPL
jgi:hypothetical protein